MEKDKGKMKKLTTDKTAIFLDDFELEVLGSYLAELLDDKSGIPDYARVIISNAYVQMVNDDENE